MRKKHLSYIVSILIIFIYACNDSNLENNSDNNSETINPNIISNDGIELKTIIVNGIERNYFLYIPESYNQNTITPLVINFHGLGESVNQYMNEISDMRSLAESKNFILVYPQGELLEGNTHWNVGAWTTGSTSDDIGFTNELINQISEEFTINQNKIYACGYSTGGAFCYELACQSNNRIAAIGTVSATMTSYTFINCNPSSATPVISIHGTTDSIIPYNGDLSEEITSQQNIIDFWVSSNNTDETFSSETITNGLGSYKHYRYDNGDNGSHIEHYQIISGSHDWPSTINTNTILWDFMSQFEL